MIRFTCPSCKTILQTGDDQGGVLVGYPNRQSAMKVPVPIVPPASVAPTVTKTAITTRGVDDLIDLSKDRDELCAVGSWKPDFLDEQCMRNRKYSQGMFRTIELFMLDALLFDLRSPDPLVRDEAAYRLGGMGALDAEAIPSLLLIAQDVGQQQLVRVIAAEAVTKIDPAQTSVFVDVLMKALNSGYGPIQSVAVCDLGALGKHAEPALTELFRLLGDDCAGVKADAGESIWQITGNRGPAERVGYEFLRSESWLTERSVRGCLKCLKTSG